MAGLQTGLPMEASASTENSSETLVSPFPHLEARDKKLSEKERWAIVRSRGETSPPRGAIAETGTGGVATSDGWRYESELEF